jgi:glycerate kinase
VCPDKFRGTLSAPDAAEAMARGLHAAGFDEVRVVPLADGGEGTLDALLARGGSRRRVRVTGPLGDPVDAEYGVTPAGLAVLEMAQASGLALVARNDPLRASTRGTGELIAAAVRGGAHRALLGVGGSASTDGGLAALEALGWSLGSLELTVACDVTIGFLDAAARFGPQKGATDAQVALLRRRLERLADVYQRRTAVDVTVLEGGGAAGGLAGGLAALGAHLEPGFEVVALEAGLEEALEDATMVVTGEGRLDANSFAGKVVGGVLDWAGELGIEHRAVIVGQASAGGREELTVHGPAQLLALTDRVFQSGEAYGRAALLVEEAAVEAGRTARATR